MDCPNNHGQMEKKSGKERIEFRGKTLEVITEHYVCPQCGIKADDIPLASRNQKALSDSYRKSAGMLTGDEIVEERKKRNWSQAALASAINVGIASIKRWETGQIQTKAMDDSLRRVFQGGAQPSDPYTGNRVISLPRIKLVLEAFSAKLGRQLLRKGNRLLYAGKYLWYADMIAFRELGQSMTGAPYATLPQGPQLNNYRDLVDLIREADAAKAEPLSEHEERIINKIALSFPSDQSVYKASHEEPCWKNHCNGELIPYSDADNIRNV